MPLVQPPLREVVVSAQLNRAFTPGAKLRARELRESIGWDRSRLSHQVRRME